VNVEVIAERRRRRCTIAALKQIEADGQPALANALLLEWVGRVVLDALDLNLS